MESKQENEFCEFADFCAHDDYSDRGICSKNVAGLIPIIFYSYQKLWEVIFELHHDVWDFNGEMYESGTSTGSKENRPQPPPI